MRNEEFPQQVKDDALRRCGYRCERCWSADNLEFHHKVPMAREGGSTLENCVVLCEKCHVDAPSHPVIFEELYLPFASPKEFIQHYNASDEKEAIEEWCNERGLEPSLMAGVLGESGRAGLIKEKMRQKARKGALVGGYAPFGYDFENGELKINSKEASIVRDMHRKYLNGQTMVSIAEDLNVAGTKTKKRGKWTIWSIRHILRNPTYAGYVRWDEELSEGRHEPIIDVETFNSVQKRIVDNIRNPKFKYAPTILPESS